MKKLVLAKFFTPSPSAGEVPFPWMMNFVTYYLWDKSSLLTNTGRNFSKVKVFPHCPSRSCLQNTGPLEVSLIPRTMVRKTGEKMTSPERIPGMATGTFFEFGLRRVFLLGFIRNP